MNSFSLCLICRYLYLLFLRYNFAGYRFLSLCLLSCNTLNTLLHCSLSFFVMKNQGPLIYDNSLLPLSKFCFAYGKNLGKSPNINIWPSHAHMYTGTCIHTYTHTYIYAHMCTAVLSHVYTHISLSPS